MKKNEFDTENSQIYMYFRGAKANTQFSFLF